MEIIKKIVKFFQRHPQSAGMTYWEHFWHALFLSGNFLFGSIITLIHAIAPFWFKTCAQNTITRGMIAIDIRAYKAAMDEAQENAITHKVVEGANEELHLIPEGEEDIHNLDGDKCWCDPDEVGGMAEGDNYWLHYSKEQTVNMKDVKERLN